MRRSPRRSRKAQRKRHVARPLRSVEAAYRGLVAAVIVRALRDLRLPAHCAEARRWLEGEGYEWGLWIDLDLGEFERKKGQGRCKLD